MKTHCPLRQSRKQKPCREILKIRGIGPIVLERSQRARRLILSIRPFKGVRVAVPRGISFDMAKSFANSKSDWIRKHLPSVRIREEESLLHAETVSRINRDEARDILLKRLKRLADRHGYRFNRLSVRNQKTRWGSCSAANNISLNIQILLLPEDLQDFILLHELVHTKIKDHGKRFWNEMLKREPRARELSLRIHQLHI